MKLLTNNSAGRLYNIIYDIQNETTNEFHEVLQNVFNNASEDTASNMNDYVAMYQLVLNAKEEVMMLNSKSQDAYIEPLNNVQEALARVEVKKNGSGFYNFKTYMDNTKMTSLKYCAIALSDKSDAKELADEQIREIEESIEQHIETISKMSIDDELKTSLINNLLKINKMIVKYKIYGNDGINEIIERSVGQVMVNAKKDANKEEKAALSDFLEGLSKVHNVIKFSKDSGLLLTTIANGLMQIG